MQWCPERQVSLQPLRHLHEVAGHLRIEAGDEWSCTDVYIAAPMIEAGQFPANVDDLKVDEMATRIDTKFFGCVHETRAKAGFLAMWIDGEQAEVGSVPSWFDVHAACECSAFLCKQKRSFSE